MVGDETRLMQTAMDAVADILADYVPGQVAAAGLEPIREVRRGFSGVMANPPTAWIIPVKTNLAPEGRAQESESLITLRLGLVGADIEQLTNEAVAYVIAVDAAIRAASDDQALPGTVKRVYIADHDYAIGRGKGGGFGAFPDLDLRLEMKEVL